MPLTPTTGVFNLISLGFLVYGIISSGHVGLSGRPLVDLVVLVVAVASWLVWLAARSASASVWEGAALVGMAVGGGVLTSSIPLAMVFPAVAAMGASLSLPLRPALAVVALGAGAATVAELVGGLVVGLELGTLSAVLGGATAGVTRRAAMDRTRAAAEVELERAKADAETARAELLAGRNYIARELHDVLAHSLAGLAIQIEALEALMNMDGRPGPRVEDQLGQIKRLVREGLDEARNAVAALREDLPPLDERLRKLAAESGARVEVTGRVTDLSAEVSTALYRVAQEALTNVLKHAPGRTAEVHLDYGERAVALLVANPLAQTPEPTPLGRSGGGYGLQGMRERILLVGGRVEAGIEGPAGEESWQVRTEVPILRT